MVELDDDVLAISGEREHTEESSDERYYRFERRYGSFRRSVSMPDGIDQRKIAAQYDKGVLEVRVSKTEEQKPMHSEIQANGTIEGAGAAAPGRLRAVSQ